MRRIGAAACVATLVVVATLPACAQNLVIDTTAANSPFAVTAGNQTFANIIVGNTTTGTLNQSGGTLTANGGGFDLRIGANGGASGIVNLTGGVLTADQVAIGAAAGATGTFNLNGGRISAGQLATQGGTSTFNFNGGTLQATGNAATFMQGLTTANIRAGGAVIDTNGFNITIAQALLHSTIPGDGANDGGLTVQGAGTLTLTGQLGYRGTTTVANGSLILGDATNSVTLPGDLSLTGGNFALSNGSLGNGTVTTNGNALVIGLIANTRATAGSATINNTGPVAFQNSGDGGTALINNAGLVDFADMSNAAGATINNSGGGLLQFRINSSAGNATIVNGAGTSTTFGGNSTAANATITSLPGALLTFQGQSTAGNATIITQSGAALDGTGTVFRGFSTGGTSRQIVAAAGLLDISQVGTVGLQIGSLEGAGIVGLGTTNLLVGGNNLSTTFSGTIQNNSLSGGGAGGLVKVGSGTLMLTGTNTYAGATLVNGGTLEVDGVIANTSAVNVNAGGTLSGSGVVDPVNVTIATGATLAPGNGTPGTSLTIVGNLAFQSGALYLVQLSGASASFANVTGTATLGGASVNVVAGGGSLAKRYRILTAAGGVTGTFAPAVTTNIANLRASLSYDPTNAYLDLSLVFGANGGGLSLNQQAVGNALGNAFNRNGSIPLALAGLTPAGLTQVSGELATASQQSTFDAMNLFLGLLTDPFMGRGDGFGGAASRAGYGEEDDQASAYAARRRNDAFAMFAKAPRITPFEQRWSVWAAGYGGSQTTSGNAFVGSNDATSRIAGTAVGADYRLSPNTLAGFALAGGGTSFGVNNLGSGRSDLFQAGAYVRHTRGAAYLTGALAYGWQDITTNRTVTAAGLDQLRAEFNANTYSGRLEGGYRFIAPWAGGVGVTPYAAGQFTTFDLPAYAETVVSGTPNFALGYAARSVTDARSELGLRADKSFAAPNGVLALRGRVAWAHDFDPDRAIMATFQALPGASFVVSGAARAADSALTSAAAEWKWVNGWSAAGTFEGEFSNVTRSLAGKGVIRYAW